MDLILVIIRDCFEGFSVWSMIFPFMMKHSRLRDLLGFVALLLQDSAYSVQKLHISRM